MDRRQAVQMVAVLVGGSILGAEMFVQMGCKSTSDKSVDKGSSHFFTKEEIVYLDEIAETILPKTNTPGAKDANVGAFMNVMVRDCYSSDDQQIFKQGMQKVEQLSKQKYKTGFMQLQSQQRTELLTMLDKEAKAYIQTSTYKLQKEKHDESENLKDSIEQSKGNFSYTKKNMPQHYFKMMKDLTLLGFFTSEAGATKALRYVAVPGKYEPCIPYKKGDRGWATA